MIGIKQTIWMQWLDKAASCVLAGMNVNETRDALHEYLRNPATPGTYAERSDETRRFAVNAVMKTWAHPRNELLAFRDAALLALRDNRSDAPALHWAIISAAFPFWYELGRHTGRILTMQNLVTQTQVISRVSDSYGDRQSVSRYGRFIVRSFVEWGFLADADTHGCYQAGPKREVSSPKILGLLYEAALRASGAERQSAVVSLSDPWLFPFLCPAVSSVASVVDTDRVVVERYGLNEETLSLATDRGVLRS